MPPINFNKIPLEKRNDLHIFYLNRNWQSILKLLEESEAFEILGCSSCNKRKAAGEWTKALFEMSDFSIWKNGGIWQI